MSTDILQRIVAVKREEIAAGRARRSHTPLGTAQETVPAHKAVSLLTRQSRYVRREGRQIRQPS